MLNPSSSDEDEPIGGFGNYNNPSSKTTSGLQSRKQPHYTRTNQAVSVDTPDSGHIKSNIATEHQLHSQKYPNGSAAVGTPYRNLSSHSDSVDHQRHGGHSIVREQTGQMKDETSLSRLKSQQSVPGTRPMTKEDLSVSSMSLNTGSMRPVSAHSVGQNPPYQHSSTFSVNSSVSGGYGGQPSHDGGISPNQATKMSHSSSGVSQPDIASTNPIPTAKDPAALELEKNEREEQEQRRLLQLRYLRITKQQLHAFQERFQSFLNGELDVVGDEAFTNAIQSYVEVFLRSDRVASMVRAGGCSMHDFREVFRLNSEHRVRCLPQIEGLNKSNVVSAWMVKFDQICRGGSAPSTALQKLQVPQPELVMSKEQLYDLFQSTLGVKRYEHQILYNALQLDNADEQAAQVRRELDGQLQMAEELSRTRQHPRLVFKDMESLYTEELRKMVGELMLRLEAVPVNKGSGGSFQKFKKHNRTQGSTGSNMGSNLGLYREHSEETTEVNLKNKLDIQLNFCLEIVVGQVRNLKHLPANKMVYCTMEVEGGEKLQTDLAEAGKPSWGTQGDFTTNQPLPTVKVKLYSESSGLLSLDSGKELGRVVLNPTSTGNRQPEWHKLQPTKGVPDDLGIQLTIRMDKPTNLKYCGYLYAIGRTAFKKWKRRYICLIQVSQYTFIMASYKERKSDPFGIMQLEGFTVDFCDAIQELALLGGKHFFNLLKEGDSVTFATDDVNERQLWVQAIYRATGQTHKPVAAPKSDSTGVSRVSNATNPRLSGRTQGDVDRARKHGLDEFVSVEPWRTNHAELFGLLQTRALDHRMKDSYVSLGWFSPSQMFVLDEYCARYGVRGCHRHLCYLSDLLDRAEHGIMIDPALIHYSYAFCCCHVFGNAQDSNIRTVLLDERDMFIHIRDRLYALLEKQIMEFRYYFPFGRPEGALKLTLGLLERVLMKDTGAPTSAEEVREVIRRCLAQAALVNYTRISEYAAIESGRDTGSSSAQHLSSRNLPDLIHLAELCIEVLRQNEEHHAEAFAWFQDLLVEHSEMFWNFFSTDMTSVLNTIPPDCWESFPLFQLLNDYLISEDSLKNGKFHQQLTQLFAPLVVRYVDLMEASIAQSVGPADEHLSEAESSVVGGLSAFGNVGALGNVGSLVSAATAGVANAASAASRAGGLMAAAANAANVGPVLTNPTPVTSAELVWKLEALQTFIRELHWPDATFAEHLDNRLKMMAADMIDSAAQRNVACFDVWLKRSVKSTDFILPNECCNMINTVADLKSSILKLCTKDIKGEDMHQYHNQIETNLERIQRKMAILLNEKMGSVLEGVLLKLARYDANTILSSVLSLAKPTDEGGKAYVEFLRTNLEQMRQKVSDELYVLSLMETWYMTQTRMINDWLTERKGNALNPYQFNCLSTIIKKMHTDFELQGVSPDALDTMAYKTITQRLQVEETTQAIRPESSTSPSRSLLGTITGSLSGFSSNLSKPGFLGRG